MRWITWQLLGLSPISVRSNSAAFVSTCLQLLMKCFVLCENTFGVILRKGSVRVLTDMWRYRLANVSIASLSVSSGPTTGSTLVTLTGAGFIQSASLVCKFGNAVVAYTGFTSASVMVCATPAHVAGTVSVEVSNNNADYSFSGSAFTYQGATLVSL